MSGIDPQDPEGAARRSTTCGGADAPARPGVRTAAPIERLLAIGAERAFRVRGRCMYPTVRAGDRLTVRSCSIDEVSTGDIAVFRLSGFLLAHRVIETRTIDGRACVVTRPDGVSEGSDSPTFDENLLGIVTSISRGGRAAPLQPSVHPWPLALYFRIRLRLMHVAWPWIAKLGEMMKRAQASPVRRRIVDAWLRVSRPEISFTVRIAAPGLGGVVHRQTTPEAFDLRGDWRGRPLDRWTLALHLNRGNEPAASLTTARDPGGNWRTEDVVVRPAYRGTAVQDALVRRLKTILDGDPARRAPPESPIVTNRSGAVPIH